jgi:hypothetical protein
MQEVKLMKGKAYTILELQPQRVRHAPLTFSIRTGALKKSRDMRRVQATERNLCNMVTS